MTDRAPKPYHRDVIAALVADGALTRVGWRCDQAIGEGDRHLVCAHSWPCGSTYAVSARPGSNLEQPGDAHTGRAILEEGMAKLGQPLPENREPVTAAVDGDAMVLVRADEQPSDDERAARQRRAPNVHAASADDTGARWRELASHYLEVGQPGHDPETCTFCVRTAQDLGVPLSEVTLDGQAEQLTAYVVDGSGHTPADCPDHDCPWHCPF